jgi:hypothetical protein
MGRSRWISERRIAGGRWSNEKRGIAVGRWSKEKAKRQKPPWGTTNHVIGPHLQCERNWAHDLDKSWRK